MSDAKKFRFVSPGIFLNEVDQSQIPEESEATGPVIIGRAEKGPGMIPVKINTFSEFVEIFGAPIDGKGGVDDLWRDTNRSSPTYGGYAAQAYLKAGVGPITYIRLMGTQHESATSTSGQAGWKTSGTLTTSVATNGGSYGLWAWKGGTRPTGTLTVLAPASLTLQNPNLTASFLPLDGGTALAGGAWIATAHSSSTTATTFSTASSAPADVASEIADSMELARVAGLRIASVSATDAVVTVTMPYATSSADGILFTGTMVTGLSASTTATTGFVATDSTCSLAATFYLNEGKIELSGTAADDTTQQDAACVIKSDSAGNFKAVIYEDDGTTVAENVTFNMTEGSSNFIRNSFNTNPQAVNAAIESGDLLKTYWLGETFERDIAEAGSNTGNLHGVILGIASGSTNEGPYEQNMPYRDAHSGWFFSQNTSADLSAYTYAGQDKLFKFVGINGHGEWLHKNVKISLSNIKASSNDNNPYGTFDVVLRKASDSDLKPVVLERYSNCTLNPASLDYLPIKIGDMYQVWDDTEDRYREYGDYPNLSSYVRVVVSEAVSNGATSPAILPFGVFGPPRFERGSFSSGSLTLGNIKGSGSIPVDLDSLGVYADGYYHTMSCDFPTVGIRSTATQDASTADTNTHFGLHTGKSSTVTTPDAGYGDYLGSLGADVITDASWGDTFGLTGYGQGKDEQWIFTLDEIVTTRAASGAVTEATWTSGSLVAGTSDTGVSKDYKTILDRKVNRFTSPMFGGFDGLDITERDPFRNTLLEGTTELNNYAHYTIMRAINTVADPEVIPCNIISVPGLTNESLTKHLIDVCETRADALGIIDVKGGFQPRHESNSAISSRQGNLANVLSNMKARNLNNSYGCAYYPWVTIRDDVNGSFVKAPPSVVGLGVLGNTEKAAEVWFAPAGFNRGGLSQGAGGVPVLSVETKLTSRNRDDLYDVNINPIASFPAEGLVVFGQKTLQSTRSALDRINVRRLLIFTKRGISEIAASTLFQPNVQDTWNSFKSRADNFLADVKVRFGVDDFRVVLDETTTTPDLVDRNIMYAKIFIKPTRAIEFIAIDFVITKSGASFED